MADKDEPLRIVREIHTTIKHKDGLRHTYNDEYVLNDGTSVLSSRLSDHVFGRDYWKFYRVSDGEKVQIGEVEARRIVRDARVASEWMGVYALGKRSGRR